MSKKNTTKVVPRENFLETPFIKWWNEFRGKSDKEKRLELYRAINDPSMFFLMQGLLNERFGFVPKADRQKLADTIEENQQKAQNALSEQQGNLLTYRSYVSSESKALSELLENIEAKKQELQPQLEAAKKKLDEAIRKAEAEYAQTCDEILKPVYALKTEKLDREGYIQIMQGNVSATDERISGLQQHIGYYECCMDQITLPRVTIIDADFKLADVALVVGEIYSTQEELDINPMLKEVCDHVLERNDHLPDIMKLIPRREVKKKEKDLAVRADAISTLALTLRYEQKRYKMVLGSRMYEFMSPYLKEMRLPLQNF